MATAEKANLVQRAFAAWARETSKSGTPEDFPTGDSTVRTLKGLQYVVLRSSNKTVLAIYRIKNDGFLRRMRRPPKALLGD